MRFTRPRKWIGVMPHPLRYAPQFVYQDPSGLLARKCSFESWNNPNLPESSPLIARHALLTHSE